MPIVSVIIPCYRQAAYLPDCLDSLLAQHYTDWEAIIVNDGSPDNPDAVLHEYLGSHPSLRHKLTYLTQENCGVSAARNRAILASQGEYILPLDADDRLSPEAIALMVEAMQQEPQPRIVYSRVQFFGHRSGEWQLPPYSFESLLWGNMIPNTALYRRADYDRTSGYNPNMVHGYEDWDFYLSLLCADDKVVKIPQLLLYCHSEVESSRTAEADRYEKNLLQQIYHNHTDLYIPYADQLLFYRYRWEDTLVQLDRALLVRRSHAYRIGRILLAPIRWLKKMLS